MLKSKYGDPLENFDFHGYKTIGGYSYVLLVDETGQTLIQRTSADSSTVMYTLMDVPPSDQKNVIAQAITTFWAGSIASYSYVYLFQL